MTPGDPPVLARPATRRVAIAMTALVLFAGLVALTARRNNNGQLGDASLDVHGRAVVTSPNGAARTVTGATSLKTGDIVEIADGTMVMTLPTGATLEGRT